MTSGIYIRKVLLIVLFQWVVVFLVFAKNAQSFVLLNHNNNNKKKKNNPNRSIINTQRYNGASMKRRNFVWKSSYAYATLSNNNHDNDNHNNKINNDINNNDNTNNNHYKYNDNKILSDDQKKRHIRILNDSLQRLTGKGLSERMNDIRNNAVVQNDNHNDNDQHQLDHHEDIHTIVDKNKRYVVISHTTSSDPIFNYGNDACLEAFALTREIMYEMPSGRSVVHRSKDESLRNQLMKSVTEKGFMEGATGIRIRGDGTFFKFINGVVWNLYDEEGDYYGQAALFDRDLFETID
eukprot:CAMPEP_0184860792 /NCGR_PEP_ID=MMETSP0580-20130426/5603_1 /TAXON_ID=1118495 /ORGANISM="Dactyliosolen fragilissimus" /LENGTH=293 /DNA_ID=CAMNT_0027358017 /DNA_START=38 /DNA_END=919 /DNA_ORIENTATION=-